MSSKPDPPAALKGIKREPRPSFLSDPVTSRDLFGVCRGRCLACDRCGRYQKFTEEYTISVGDMGGRKHPDNDLSIVNCSRCGCPNDAHEVSRHEQERELGNDAFAREAWDAALLHYSKAIELCPSDAALWSNRAAAYLAKGWADQALRDAEHALSLRPDWGKAHGRKAAALLQLGRAEAAVAAYQAGLRLDGGSQTLQEGMRRAQLAFKGEQRKQAQSVQKGAQQAQQAWQPQQASTAANQFRQQGQAAGRRPPTRLAGPAGIAPQPSHPTAATASGTSSFAASQPANTGLTAAEPAAQAILPGPTSSGVSPTISQRGISGTLAPAAATQQQSVPDTAPPSSSKWDGVSEQLAAVKEALRQLQQQVQALEAAVVDAQGEPPAEQPAQPAAAAGTPSAAATSISLPVGSESAENPATVITPGPAGSAKAPAALSPEPPNGRPAMPQPLTQQPGAAATHSTRRQPEHAQQQVFGPHLPQGDASRDACSDADSGSCSAEECYSEVPVAAGTAKRGQTAELAAELACSDGESEPGVSAVDGRAAAAAAVCRPGGSTARSMQAGSQAAIPRQLLSASGSRDSEWSLAEGPGSSADGLDASYERLGSEPSQLSTAGGSDQSCSSSQLGAEPSAGASRRRWSGASASSAASEDGMDHSMQDSVPSVPSMLDMHGSCKSSTGPARSVSTTAGSEAAQSEDGAVETASLSGDGGSRRLSDVGASSSPSHVSRSSSSDSSDDGSSSGNSNAGSDASDSEGEEGASEESQQTAAWLAAVEAARRQLAGGSGTAVPPPSKGGRREPSSAAARRPSSGGGSTAGAAGGSRAAAMSLGGLAQMCKAAEAAALARDAEGVPRAACKRCGHAQCARFRPTTAQDVALVAAQVKSQQAGGGSASSAGGLSGAMGAISGRSCAGCGCASGDHESPQELAAREARQRRQQQRLEKQRQRERLGEHPGAAAYTSASASSRQAAAADAAEQRRRRVAAAAERRAAAAAAGEQLRESDCDVLGHQKRGACSGCASCPGFRILFRTLDANNPEVMFYCSLCGCRADQHAVDAEWRRQEDRKAAEEAAEAAAAAARRAAAAVGGSSAARQAEAAAYAELGLPLGADAKSVARAYKRLALQLHPDKQQQTAAATAAKGDGRVAQAQAATEERFHRVAAAYKLLTEAAGAKK